MQYTRPLCALAAGLLMLSGCAGDPEHARGILHSEAKSECRKLKDSSAYLECMKRADTMHARR